MSAKRCIGIVRRLWSIQRRKIDKFYNYFFELINLRNTVAALTTDGDLYCWGYNDYGQVGNGTTDNQLVPNKILENVNHILVDGATKHTQWGAGSIKFL
ncbi:MAG TPA: hypothetical protein DCY04_09760 [Eubacterium sp.]|nr:hypothetical protein [Eubacterium sp.]